MRDNWLWAEKKRMKRCMVSISMNRFHETLGVLHIVELVP